MNQGKFSDLRKPGWLPTAIVVNILTGGQGKVGADVAPKDLLKVVETGSDTVKIDFQEESFDRSAWQPEKSHPIQVIDGRHKALGLWRLH